VRFGLEYSASRRVFARLVVGLGLFQEINMQKYIIAAVFLVSFVAPVLAAETFYIVFDATLHGCTIATAEPADKTQYKVLGAYKSKAEAEKAIALMKKC